MTELSAALALLLAGVHAAAGKLRFVRMIPRSRWLSAAGGASVAYVFVHLLPELGAAQRALERAGGSPAAFLLERQLYLVALGGLAVFYGLERAVRTSRARGAPSSGEPDGADPAFRLHVGSFALYNGLVGYLLLHGEREGVRELLLFSAAMGLHFVVNDFGLRDHHREAYDRVGRWVLVGAVLVGWGVGLATAIHEAAVATLFAFLAGGVVLNVLKEELPEERESRFGAFALGVVLYAAVALLAAA